MATNEQINKSDELSYTEKKARAIGAVATVAFHSLLVLFLCLYCLQAPDIQPEEGLAVNLGAEDAGGEDFFEPTPMEEITSPAPEPVEPVASSAPELPTQDLEETVSLNKSKKEVKTEKPKPSAEEIAKKKQLEAEKAEKARLAKLEQQKRAEEERKAKEIQNRMSGAFSNKNNGTDANSKGTGGGNAGGTKGSENGAVGGSQGNAKSGRGNIFSLDGRSPNGALTRPNYNSNEEGRVVVNITVDRAGNVLDATVGRGTNTDSQTLRRAAIEAAKKTKFNKIEHGPDRQTGSITYNFELR